MDARRVISILCSSTQKQPPSCQKVTLQGLQYLSDQLHSKSTQSFFQFRTAVLYFFATGYYRSCAIFLNEKL